MSEAATAPRRIVDGELTRINQALYDEFVRTTGQTSRSDFATWVVDLRRGLGAGFEDPVFWAELSSREQAAMLLGQLRASPPAAWPSLAIGA